MIKKIIISSVVLSFVLVGAIIVSAQTTGTDTTMTTTTNTEKQIDIACVKTAVETRENTIKATFDKFSSSISSALQTRKSDLLNAWSIADKAQRKTAIKTAWDNFKKSKKDAIKTHRTEQLAAWKQFKISRKDCGSGPTGENPGHDISI